MNTHDFSRPRMANQDELSWYDRHLLDGLTQFGPDPQDGFTVFVTPEAVIALHVGTHSQAPHEAIGLLMGRAYADDSGCFTVVSGVVYADGIETSEYEAQLSKEEMLELRLQASRTYPTADFVGWTHSHRTFSQYSSIDIQEQKNWTRNYHIGILTFMDRIREAKDTHWAIAYRGPSAQLLPFYVDEAPLLRKLGDIPLFKNEKRKPFFKNPLSRADNLRSSEQSTSTSQGRKILVPSLPSQKQSQQSHGEHPQQFQKLTSEPSQKRYKQGILSLLRVIFMIAIIIISVILGNLITFDLTTTRPTFSTTNLLWNCNQQMGHIPLTITCNGPLGPNIKGWIWNFGDGAKIQGNSVTHIYRKSGTYTITLTIAVSINQQPEANINAGSLSIEVIALTPPLMARRNT